MGGLFLEICDEGVVRISRAIPDRLFLKIHEGFFLGQLLPG